MPMRPLLPITLVATVALSACQQPAPSLAISDAVVQLPAVPGRPAVAYFTAVPGAHARITAVAVDHFARAQMHQSLMQGGAMTMQPVDSVPVEPGQPVHFAPAGLHVMLFDGDGSLKPGGMTTLAITLDNGTRIAAPAKVTSAGGDDMPMKM